MITAVSLLKKSLQSFLHQKNVDKIRIKLELHSVERIPSPRSHSPLSYSLAGTSHLNTLYFLHQDSKYSALRNQKRWICEEDVDPREVLEVVETVLLVLQKVPDVFREAVNVCNIVKEAFQVPGIRDKVLDASGVLEVIEEILLERTWRVCRGGKSS